MAFKNYDQFIEVQPVDAGMKVGGQTDSEIVVTRQDIKTTTLRDATLSADSETLTITKGDGTTLEFQGGGGGESNYFKANSDGTAASATGTDAIAIGESAQAAGTESLAIGENSRAEGTQSIHIGTGDNNYIRADSLRAVAFGHDSRVDSDASYGMAIGATARVAEGHDHSIALGRGAVSTAPNQLTIGHTVSGLDISAIRTPGFTGGENQYIAVDATGNWSTAEVDAGGASVTYATTPPSNPSNGDLWFNCDSDDLNTYVYDADQDIWIDTSPIEGSGGGDTTYFKANSTGTAASATGADAIAIGEGTTATGTESIVIGNVKNSRTPSAGNNSIAIGSGAKADGADAIAIGEEANADHVSSIAIGDAATTDKANQMRIGDITEILVDTDYKSDSDYSLVTLKQLQHIGHGFDRYFPDSDYVTRDSTSSLPASESNVFASDGSDLRWRKANQDALDTDVGVGETIRVEFRDTSNPFSTPLLGYYDVIDSEYNSLDDLFTLTLSHIRGDDPLADNANARDSDNEYRIYISESSLADVPFDGSHSGYVVAPSSSERNTNHFLDGTGGFTEVNRYISITGTGNAADAVGTDSVVIGAGGANAIGANTVAVGYGSEAEAQYSLALGYAAQVTNSNHNNSIVIGQDADSTDSEQLSIVGVQRIRTPQFTGGSNQYIAVDANGNWSTATVMGGDGGITSVTSDATLTGDGTSSNALGVDTDIIADTEFVKGLPISTFTNDSGYVTTDTNTTYSAGNGITLTDTTFSANIGYGLEFDENANDSEIEVNIDQIATRAYVQTVVNQAKLPNQYDTERSDASQLIYTSINDANVNFNGTTQEGYINMRKGDTITFPVDFDHQNASTALNITGDDNVSNYFSTQQIAVFNPVTNDAQYDDSLMLRYTGSGNAPIYSDTERTVSVEFHRGGGNASSFYSITGRLQLFVGTTNADNTEDAIYQRDGVDVIGESSEFTLNLLTTGNASATDNVTLAVIPKSDGHTLSHNQYFGYRWIIHANHYDYNSDDPVSNIPYIRVGSQQWGDVDVQVQDAKVFVGTDKKVYYQNVSGNQTAVELVDTDGQFNLPFFMNNATSDSSPAEASGDDSISIGRSSNATQSRTVAIGDDARATGSHGIAIGRVAMATASSSVSIGPNTDALGQQSIALGGSVSAATGPQATGTDSIAIGFNTNSSHNQSIALGREATTDTENQLVIGGATNSTSIHRIKTPHFRPISNDADRHVIIDSDGVWSLGAGGGGGFNADTDRVAIGNGSAATADGTVAIGSAVAESTNSVAIGNNAGGVGTEIIGTDAVAIGTSTLAEDSDAIAIGNSARANSAGSIAIGGDANASSEPSIAIGSNANASGFQTITIGHDATTTGNNSIVIGRQASTDQDQAVVIGREANADGANATAIGALTDADGTNSVAVGVGAQAAGNRGIAIGNDAIADQSQSVAIGQGANTQAVGQICFSSNMLGLSLPVDDTPASDPTNMPDGTIYYNSNSNSFRAKLNGNWGTLDFTADP